MLLAVRDALWTFGEHSTSLAIPQAALRPRAAHVSLLIVFARVFKYLFLFWKRTFFSKGIDIDE